MLKITVVLVLVLTSLSKLSAEEQQLVNEKNWENFLDSSASRATGVGIGESCKIRSSCQLLKRIVVSCDAETVAVGCGGCEVGFRLAESADRCVPTSSDSLGAALEAEKLIDSLAVSSSMEEKQHSHKADLQLKASKDAPSDASSLSSASSSSTSAGGRNDSSLLPPPLPPPHSPPIRRVPPDNGDFAFYVIIGTTCGLGILLIVICAICWYKYNVAIRKTAEKDYLNADYTLHSSGSSGDGKLAMSAHMYHYQHQKQQMLALDRSNSDLQRDMSDDDSDLENDEADFTVYECPGLATTKEMEVRNPLFKEDIAESPATTNLSAGAQAGAQAGDQAAESAAEGQH